jgi:hypothetical protein
MRRQFVSLLAVAAALLTLPSCTAVLSGTGNSSASIDRANFTYVKKDATGTATAKYILGIGGNKRMALVSEAKQSMLATNPLQANQALSNMTVDYKIRSVLGIVNTMTCTVTSDIVEFKD